MLHHLSLIGTIICIFLSGILPPTMPLAHSQAQEASANDAGSVIVQVDTGQFKALESEPAQGLQRMAAPALAAAGVTRVQPLFPGALAPEQWQARNAQRFPQRAARAPRLAALPDLRQWLRVDLAPGVDAEAAAANLRRLAPVLQAEPWRAPVPTTLPDDPLFSSVGAWGQAYNDRWALEHIGLGPLGSGAAWDVSTGSRAVVVAVGGAGLDYNHPDLRDNLWVNPGEDLDGDRAIWDPDDRNRIDDDGDGLVDDVHGWNFQRHSNDVMDSGAYMGHDTVVAGIVGAVGNNGQGSTGVNWQVSLLPFDDIVAGWMYVVDQGADVIVASYDFDGSASLAPQLAYAEANGVQVVLPSNNQGVDITGRWLQGQTAMVVGAVTRNNTRPTWSSYGQRLDVVAPGSYVIGPLPLAFAGRSLNEARTPFSAARSADDALHLAYYDPERRELLYRRQTIGGWSEPETVPACADPATCSGHDVGRHQDIAIDSAGRPWIAFYDASAQALRVAQRDEAGWRVETAAADALSVRWAARGLALFLDSADRPALAYQSLNSRQVVTVHFDGASWQQELIYAASQAVDDGLAKAYDRDGAPALLFRAGQLFLARRLNGAWQTSSLPFTGEEPGLAFDAANRPHVSYGDGNRLMHAWQAGEAWQSETAVDDSYQVRWTSLAMDAYDRPQIVYARFDDDWFDERTVSLRYARKVGGSWTKETVSMVDGPGYFNALLPGAAGLDVLHMGWRTGQLRWARWTSSLSASLPLTAWSDQPVVDLGYPYAVMNGTSAAAPLAAGVAALLLSVHPDWTLGQLRYAMSRTARDVGAGGFDPHSGYGVVDATAALAAQPPLDTAAPQAVITSPSPGQMFGLGEEIRVVGSAADENFHHYNLWIDAVGGQPALLFEREPRQNELLGVIDGLQPGAYQVILEAWDWEGSSLSSVAISVGSEPAPQPGGVSGAAFIDDNANGQLDPGEEGLAEVLVSVQDGAGGLAGQALSDDAGAWQVDGLRPGAYTVSSEPALGWFSTTPAVQPVDVLPGEQVTGIDLGFVSTTALAVVGLEAKRLGTANRLTWAVIDETSVEGFQVWRGEAEGGPFKPLWITPLPPEPGRTHYVVYDADLLPGQAYWYRLQVLPEDEWHGPVADGGSGFRSFLPLLLH